MPQCLVSFGANLGSKDSAVVAAVRRLAENPHVENFRVSRLYEVPAIGGPSGQSSFLNGVAAFDTTAGARNVLDWLQQIESQLGRQRSRRWEARSIDLDVVLHGTLVGAGDDLTVPHPRYTARRFVLRPACDVAADYCDPRFGWSIGRLADHLDQGSASLALTGGDEPTRKAICKRLREERGVQTYDAPPLAQPMAIVGTAPAKLRSGDAAGAKFGPQPSIDPPDDRPWVADFVPRLPLDPTQQIDARLTPRLVARIQWTTPEDRWPAPHRIWPARSEWPEYHLEVDDLQWTVGEIVSALASMRCAIDPISDDQNWWQ